MRRAGGAERPKPAGAAEGGGPGGVALSFEDICVLLYDEHGWDAAKVKTLTRHYVQTVILNRRRDEKGRLVLSADRDAERRPRVSWEDEWRAVFMLRGWPGHRIEERIGEERARRRAEAEREAAARRGRAPGPRHNGHVRVRRR